MAKFILAKKLGMTQVFEEDGTAIPVTVLEAGPCSVLQVRTNDKDGYTAVQLGFGTKSKRSLSRALKGHLGDLGLFRWLCEFRIDDDSEWKRGDTVKADQFEIGDSVDVAGTRKGRGFQGVVKRHGFSGGPASHGHRHVLRRGGSIGSAFPQHVMKGKKMPGRMGAVRFTEQNLKVVRVDSEKNILAVRGAVPGAPGSLVEVVSR